MNIANNVSQLQDLLMLTNLMAQLQSSEAVENLVSIMTDCGYDHDGEIDDVVSAAITIDKENEPVLVIAFKYTDDVNNAEVGKFTVTVKDCKVSGDF